jgi:hypothetical protein
MLEWTKMNCAFVVGRSFHRKAVNSKHAVPMSHPLLHDGTLPLTHSLTHALTHSLTYSLFPLYSVLSSFAILLVMGRPRVRV